MKPLISICNIIIPPPSEIDRRAYDQRIRDSLKLNRLEIPLEVLRKASSFQQETIACVVGVLGERHKLIDTGTVKSYSIALDIGTTNLVAELYDNVSKTVAASAKEENLQIQFGSDIMTRMHHCMGGRAEEVYQALNQGVNAIINTLCADAGIDTSNVHALVAAGNTVMSHFLLGLDISTIPVEPFTPVARQPGFCRASEIGLNINVEGLVYVLPNAGSYVGGDIIAGILATGIHLAEEPCMLIDVGTNAEVVIGCKDWLLVGAGAAGPALEEGIAGIGKRADSGIIYDLNIHDSVMECSTFDNTPPNGICGSGMVSLIYELYKAEIIGRDGQLNTDSPGVGKNENCHFYTLPCAPDGTLVISQPEIDNFLRSKAAMFTLLLVLLRSVGLQFRDISKVYVAGALGNGINAGKASAIGMLPEWPADRISPVGNTSLLGALMIIQDSSLLQQEDSIIDKITYKHMHDDPEFMKEFQGGMFIPHTNPELLRA
ncbi:MAG: DUF4445 domain-containing protein [Nitrospira sp.]|nr:DUF4445 domain-containing protein [bacterium]MBL7048583.1 DUF4445 domain-containing protein [Nitrospira sp.]